MGAKTIQVAGCFVASVVSYAWLVDTSDWLAGAVAVLFIAAGLFTIFAYDEPY